MSEAFDCIITSSTYYADGAHFEFELADHQHDLELTKAVFTNGGLKCRLVIGGAEKHVPAIINRWSDGPLTYCLPEDVERLEARNAELLEALKAVEVAVTMGFPPAEILHYDSAIRKGIRAAIAKAEGNNP